MPNISFASGKFVENKRCRNWDASTPSDLGCTNICRANINDDGVGGGGGDGDGGRINDEVRKPTGGDQDTLDFVAYVGKDDLHNRACFVLECEGGLAQDVIATIGQAFELRCVRHKSFFSFLLSVMFAASSKQLTPEMGEIEEIIDVCFEFARLDKDKGKREASRVVWRLVCLASGLENSWEDRPSRFQRFRQPEILITITTCQERYRRTLSR